MSKTQIPKALELVRGNAILGTIEVKPGEADLPWYTGTFRPSAEFETVRDLFKHELELLRANTTNDSAQWDDWEAVHSELHEPGIRLRAMNDSYQADDILIHIDGAEAWWRSE